MQELNSIQEKANFDSVWVLFQETREQIKQTSAQLKENDRILTERQKKTEKMLSEMFKDVAARFKETDTKFKETDRMLSEKFKETQKMVGRVTNSWGEFVEGIVIPSVIQMFNERNIEIERVSQRVKSRKSGNTMEIDIIGDNSSYVVAIEVKSKLLSDNVIKFAEKLDNFKYFFPNYADKKLVAAVAGVTVDESVKNFAEKKGLFVIMQKGETVEIVNDKNFMPKEW
jgi:hypothetical protein